MKKVVKLFLSIVIVLMVFLGGVFVYGQYMTNSSRQNRVTYNKQSRQVQKTFKQGRRNVERAIEGKPPKQTPKEFFQKVFKGGKNKKKKNKKNR